MDILPRIVVGAPRAELLARMDSDFSELISVRVNRQYEAASVLRVSALVSSLREAASKDPSLLLEPPAGVKSAFPNFRHIKNYLELALECDLPPVVKVALDAGIPVHDSDLYGERPLLDVRRGLTTKPLPPSLDMLRLALEHGYDPNAKFDVSAEDAIGQRSMLYVYTLQYVMISASSLTSDVQSLLQCFKELISHGANEFDPITGPGQNGSGFLAILCTGRFFSTANQVKHPDLFQEALDLVHLAASRGASLDRTNNVQKTTLLTTVIECGHARMAAELIGLGCNTHYTGAQSSGLRMSLIEHARKSLGDDGCALVVEALMKHKIAASGSPKVAANVVEPGVSVARKRMSV